MKSKCPGRLPLLILLTLLVLGLGCSAVKSTYRFSQKTAKSLTNRLSPGEDPILKKRVLMPPLIDQAGISKEGSAQVFDKLAQLLQEDSHLLIKTVPEQSIIGENIQSPQYGVIIKHDLTQTAEEMGMDVLLLGIINPFEITAKHTGIWPFRKIKREVEVSVAMNALNITNGTLFMTNLETRKIKVGEKKLENQAENDSIDFKFLAEPLSDIMEDHVSELISELNSLSWEGKIAFTDDGKLQINGGQDIGVVKGQIFEAFKKGEAILSAEGKEYHIRGNKVGELRADIVMPDYSIMVPLHGDNFKEGQIVSVKR